MVEVGRRAAMYVTQRPSWLISQPGKFAKTPFPAELVPIETFPVWPLGRPTQFYEYLVRLQLSAAMLTFELNNLEFSEM